MRAHTRRLLVIGVIVTTIAGVGAAVGLAAPEKNKHEKAPVNTNADEWPGNYPGFPDASLDDDLPLPNPLRPEGLCEQVWDEKGNLQKRNRPGFNPDHPNGEPIEVAIYADANLAYDDFTVLDISGSEIFIDGSTESRTHLKISGQRNQFLHGVEHGQAPDSVFDLSGSDNCFLPRPEAEPQRPKQDLVLGTHWPVYFDITDFDIRGPGLDAVAAHNNGEYFFCGIEEEISAANTAVNPGGDPIDDVQVSEFCDIGSGTFTASVQGQGGLPDGLYYVTGETKLAASDLEATVTFVTEDRFDASGSVDANFTAYGDRGLLFMSTFGSKNSKDLGEDALKVGGSNSVFNAGHIFAPNGRVELSGSRNYYDCTVMGDRVSLNGSNLVIIGQPCGEPPVICSGETVTDTDQETTGAFTLLSDGLTPICKHYGLVADGTNEWVTFTPHPEDELKSVETFRGLLSFDPQALKLDGTFSLGLEYQPVLGDPNDPDTWKPIQLCIDPSFTVGPLEFPGLPEGFVGPLVDGFGPEGGFPGDETWCLAGEISVSITTIHGPQVITVFQLLGREDPRFGFK